MPATISLTNTVTVILQSSGRSMSIYELVRECEPYVDEFVSYFEVKQACMHLLQENLVYLDGADPLTFGWL